MINVKKLIPLLALAVVFSCSKKSTPSASTESFDAFYDEFHADENFQMERVRFPLEGGFVDVEGETEWTPENWEIHKEKVSDIQEPGYDTEIIQKEEEVIDKVKIPDSGFYAERRFQRIDGKWYLVYYESINL